MRRKKYLVTDKVVWRGDVMRLTKKEADDLRNKGYQVEILR